MEYYDNFDYQFVDKLIQSGYRFVLTRLPHGDNIQLILQETDNDFTFQSFSEINQNGFVIAPFNVSDKYPIIYIKPEVVITGVKDISDYLSKLSYKEKSESEFGEPHVDNTTNKATYTSIFRKFHTKLVDNTFQKIVLSRLLVEKKKQNYSIGKSFIEACKKYPNSYVYVCYTPISKTWLGATPELLLSKNKDNWKTVALAGTRATSTNNTDWDKKNTKEQAFVAEYLEDLLGKLSCKIEKSDLLTLKVGNLEHLKTEFAFQNLASLPIGTILQSLHPTPATCGLPKLDTFNFIINNEEHARRYYSGFLGNISDNEANIFVNLRCVNILQEHILLFAGSGIISSSDVDSEWDETEMKLNAMLSIINEN